MKLAAGVITNNCKQSPQDM